MLSLFIKLGEKRVGGVLYSLNDHRGGNMFGGWMMFG